MEGKDSENFTITFVCWGNIHRSPLAEHLTRHRATKLKIPNLRSMYFVPAQPICAVIMMYLHYQFNLRAILMPMLVSLLLHEWWTWPKSMGLK